MNVPVSAMAISIGKKIANTGDRMVLIQILKKKESSEATQAMIPIQKYSI